MLNSFTNIDVNVVSNMTADSNSVVICFIVAVVVILLAVLRNNRNNTRGRSHGVYSKRGLSLRKSPFDEVKDTGKKYKN